MDAPPPQGTILAALPATGNEQIKLMSEIFPQDFCQAANSGKFRIVNPSTGEEVQAPQDSDKSSKRLRIVNPGTGKEVLPGSDAEKENADSLEEYLPSTAGPLQEANSNSAQNDTSKKPVGVSWDWPLSRHETSARYNAASEQLINSQ